MANIVINREEINTVCLTLSERVTIVDPFYLFYFKSKFNVEEERLFFADNISTNRLRYDLFEIEEITNPDYLDNQVDLFSGEWSYEIYQKDVKNLTIGSSDTLLEEGLVIVKDENYK